MGEALLVDQRAIADLDQMVATARVRTSVGRLEEMMAVRGEVEMRREKGERKREGRRLGKHEGKTNEGRGDGDRKGKMKQEGEWRIRREPASSGGSLGGTANQL